MTEEYVIEYKYENEIIKINCIITKSVDFKNWFNYNAYFTNEETNYKTVFEGSTQALNIDKAKMKIYGIIDDYFDDDIAF